MNLTLLYADIFDWPLSKEELFFWKINFPARIASVMDNGFYVLPRRQKLVQIRKKKEFYAVKKWEIARRVAVWMRWIPTITLVGVTGGLARNNVNQNDDIDLFCITKPGTLWISRLMAIIIVELLGMRRRPTDTDVTNKICLNMFMSEDALSVKKNEQDLFTAYEVLQMIPLWEKEGAYKKFLDANRWSAGFLPHAWKGRVKDQGSWVKSTMQGSLFTVFEPLAKTIQLWYMRKRRTTEVITPGNLRFHPHDARIWVKREFAKRLSRYNLPLDKIFYGG
ncbi:hypothetical protein A3A79_03565 [Candidatus Gottesmanbacteria bacterium RIFCSPLOWO2_01_FULL_43_11b]|uniref:Polymerase nucleotidyl transferase domain-containing protein n=1 Tax=Candidatus Gottesmanbacteria bacterium RIFCSPLOWO2_01_FULL_43_11b TaxID=1798392 RepID=A0A1F6AHL9_9BACT|nr:MAG: hypothetical protein A3A79_03565 [Candidatus Gottesmanbacteria bacterium RIFCSPLOWO2_01_FULL_43_11b]